MAQVTALFRSFNSLNVFKPEALAVVSHNNKSFVGASIAVSNFLRPLYLHKRIADFKKPRLREAIIFHQPSNAEDTQDWTSEAINIMGTYKPACTNCRRTFERLNGFVPETEPVDGKNRTFLGVCAEFCPVDKLLHDETNASDVQEIGNRLQRNLERCLTYFTKFNAISKQCQDAEDSKDIQKIREVYTQMHPTVHFLVEYQTVTTGFRIWLWYKWSVDTVTSKSIFLQTTTTCNIAQVKTNIRLGLSFGWFQVCCGRYALT